MTLDTRALEYARAQYLPGPSLQRSARLFNLDGHAVDALTFARHMAATGRGGDSAATCIYVQIHEYLKTHGFPLRRGVAHAPHSIDPRSSGGHFPRPRAS